MNWNLVFLKTNEANDPYPHYPPMKTKFLLLAFLFAALHSFAILTPQIDSIPMSDGRKLAADVYIPSGITQAPVILIQTPYNRALYRLGLPLGIGQNLNSSNYIIVVVDWRGFYGSAAAAHVGAPSMGEDGYSCVEWIAQQSWSNGKVGTWGPSALGRVQFQTAKTFPPHLTCICPLVAAPQYDYVEYYPNGCLRTEYIEQLSALGFGVQPLIMAHPVHDNTWTYVEGINNYPDSIAVPCYMIGGWYDHTIEFMLPFFTELQSQSPVNVRNQHRLLMGPWVHGGHGTAQVGSSLQGALSYPNAVDWDDSLALEFFDYHLRNINNNWEQTPTVQYYQMGDNTWQNSAAWPPGGAANVNFYFHKNGLLDNFIPASSSDSLSFNYDPNNPSPTYGGPTLRNDLLQGPYDQSDTVENRNDVLVFTTDILPQNAVMKGNAVMHLKVSSNRPDTDFDIRLTDVYPDGRSMLVNDGVARMRFRNGVTAADTATMVPGNIYNATITLPNTAITFLAGHKIRVDITSSNYPRFNRNMNTGGVMYPGNSPDSLVNPLVAANTVYTNGINVSRVELPLVGYTIPSAIAEQEPNRPDLQVFPNPAHDVLNVQYLNNTVRQTDAKICSVTGQLLVETKIATGQSVIDVSVLPAGVYTLQVQSGAGQIVKRFSK